MYLISETGLLLCSVYRLQATELDDFSKTYKVSKTRARVSVLFNDFYLNGY